MNILIDSLRNVHCSIDVFCCQETWLESSADISLLQIDGYCLVDQGKTCSERGGLACYVRNELKFKKLKIASFDVWECQFIEIGAESQNYVVGNVYRPPTVKNGCTVTVNLQTFNSEFCETLNLFSRKNHVLVCGDFNVNLLESTRDDFTSKYLDNILSSGFLPAITLPTRYSKQYGTCSLIDNIFVRSTSKVSPDIAAGIYTSGMSDHYVCYLSLKLPDNLRSKKVPKYVYINRETPQRVENFKVSLQERNLLDQLDCSSLNVDPNYNYNILESILEQEKQKCFPKTKVKFHKHKHAGEKWSSPGIARATAFRDDLLIKVRKSNFGSTEFTYYKMYLYEYQKVLRKVIRTAKRIYFEKSFERFKNDAKSTWNSINQILHRKNNSKSFPESFLINGSPITDKLIIANEFNDYYVNIGSNLADEIGSPSAEVKYTDFLNQTPKDFVFDLVSPSTVDKVIDSLKNKHSSGYDGLSSCLIKTIKNELLEPITLIVNQSISTGIFPSKLKIAKVIPIYKKDDERLIGNYRPISLLPAISKIFEKVIHRQIFRYFIERNLLFDSQYGFRKNHSTESAALELTDRILKIMDSDDVPFGIFMDLSKAFDTIDHKILLHKLKLYGFTDPALSFLTSYLSERSQFVDFNGIRSSTKNILTGVPQGSILGPLLFLIYINDIKNITTIFKIMSYADDTTLLGSQNSIKEQLRDGQTFSDFINEELQSINNWLIVNKLSLNVSKTKLMVFHKAGKIFESLSLSINNVTLDTVDKFIFLGLTIDKELNWKAHLHKTALKISRTVGILNRLKKSLPAKILLTIYNSLILPHLNYCLLCWGSANTKRFLKLQKRAVRTIIDACYNQHCDPIFKNLSILKVDDIFVSLLFKLYFKRERNFILPAYLKQMEICRISQVHSINTRQQGDIHHTMKNKAFTEAMLSYQIMSLINYANERDKPTRYLDFVLPTKIGKTDKLKLKPKAVYKEIIGKINLFGFCGFSKFCKKSLLDSYADICTKVKCYSCRRQ